MAFSFTARKHSNIKMGHFYNLVYSLGPSGSAQAGAGGELEDGPNHSETVNNKRYFYIHRTCAKLQ